MKGRGKPERFPPPGDPIPSTHLRFRRLFSERVRARVAEKKERKALFCTRGREGGGRLWPCYTAAAHGGRVALLPVPGILGNKRQRRDATEEGGKGDKGNGWEVGPGFRSRPSQQNPFPDALKKNIKARGTRF